MPHFICTACGMQYAESAAPPAQCVICEEERQYVPPRGQTWTTLDALAQSHMNSYREYEPGVIGIGAQPAFAIGQRALLLRTDRRQRAVGLRRAARCRDRDHDRGARRHRRDRHLASAFLHHDGGMGARLRVRRSISTPPTSNGSCGRIRRSSCGTATRSSCGTASRWCAAAAISKAARCCIGRAAPAAAAWSAPAISSPSPPTASGCHFMRSYPNFIPLSARDGRAYRRGDGAVRVRSDLRPLFRPRHCGRRQARCWKNPSRATSRR